MLYLPVLFSQDIAIQIEQHTLYIHPVTTIDEAHSTPDDIRKDYRYRDTDSSNALSTLKQLDLDPNFIRSELFHILHDGSIIGSFTLVLTPPKWIHTKRGIYSDGNSYQYRCVSDVLPCVDQSYIIECGWLCLSNEWRGKHIGSSILKEFLVPKLHMLSSTIEIDQHLYIICSVRGKLSDKRLFQHLRAMHKTETQSPIYLLNEEEKACINSVHPESYFTKRMSEKFGLEVIPHYYGAGLGPIYIARLY
jgi:hypothetical protein